MKLSKVIKLNSKTDIKRFFYIIQIIERIDQQTLVYDNMV
jgi:hypothetical protein